MCLFKRKNHKSEVAAAMLEGYARAYRVFQPQLDGEPAFVTERSLPFTSATMFMAVFLLFPCRTEGEGEPAPTDQREVGSAAQRVSHGMGGAG